MQGPIITDCIARLKSVLLTQAASFGSKRKERGANHATKVSPAKIEGVPSRGNPRDRFAHQKRQCHVKDVFSVAYTFRCTFPLNHPLENRRGGWVAAYPGDIYFQQCAQLADSICPPAIPQPCQYSSGRSNVVADLSASLIIQIFSPAVVLYALKIREPSLTD